MSNARRFAALAALENITVKRDETDTGYIVRKGGALIAAVPDAFINRSRDPENEITTANLYAEFTKAFHGVSHSEVRKDRAEVERRSGEVYCRLGVWGPN